MKELQMTPPLLASSAVAPLLGSLDFWGFLQPMMMEGGVPFSEWWGTAPLSA